LKPSVTYTAGTRPVQPLEVSAAMPVSFGDSTQPEAACGYGATTIAPAAL
jgi:hypothetical protein